jgi:hypothetical protein
MLPKKTFDLQQSRGGSQCVELRCPRRHGDRLLAILVGEEARMNHPRNRIRPIGTRKSSPGSSMSRSKPPLGSVIGVDRHPSKPAWPAAGETIHPIALEPLYEFDAI